MPRRAARGCWPPAPPTVCFDQVVISHLGFSVTFFVIILLAHDSGQMFHALCDSDEERSWLSIVLRTVVEQLRESRSHGSHPLEQPACDSARRCQAASNWQFLPWLDVDLAASVSPCMTSRSGRERTLSFQSPPSRATTRRSASSLHGSLPLVLRRFRSFILSTNVHR